MDERGPQLVPGATDLVARLGEWAASARVDEAAAERSREGWLLRVAGESATLAGVLLDLAESAATVVVAGVAGRRHRGVVRAVGADFCVLRSEGDDDALLATASVAWVRPDPEAPAVTGDRPVTLELGAVEALAAAAHDRPRLVVVTAPDGGAVAGELRSVGQDVVALRLDSGATAYLPATALAEVRLARP